ncbi:hypothetical protein QTP88_023003 [Uroleucon formosanum]
MLKRVGERMPPCGTPALILVISEYAEQKCTCKCRSVKYAILDNEKNENYNTDSNKTKSDKNSNANMDMNEIKIKQPPPIFVRGLLDFAAFRTVLINLVGINNFFVKSTSKNLKIQSNNSDTYRSIIKYLKESKAEYHTFQAQEDKSFRIVVRNLHLSTPTVDIGIAIQDIGYTVRSVSNVLHKTTKSKLPIFFVDLKPAEINQDIFHLNSILNTKIKIEEPYKRREIIQCINCQEYGHSKTYCAYPSRCVRCNSNHSTSACNKTSDQPPVCVLCGGAYTANYRGCQVHKNLQKLHHSKSNSNNKFNKKSNINYCNIVKGEGVKSDSTHTSPPDLTDTSSFPQLSQKPPQIKSQNNTSQNSNENSHEFIAIQLSSLISEFKLIINLLISLLTTVIDKLLK